MLGLLRALLFRPRKKGEDLEKSINDIIAIESEQEKRREDIREFVNRLKTALTALANLTAI